MMKEQDELLEVRIVTRTGRTHDIVITEDSYEGITKDLSDFLTSFDQEFMINISLIESIQIINRLEIIHN